MSRRAIEKELRRQERLEAEEAERRTAAGMRRLRIAGGAVLAVAAIAAIIAVVLAGGGDDDDGAPRTTDLTAAARAAGCTYRQFQPEGSKHTDGPVAYKTNPPTSGSHNPAPAPDGLYRPGNSPRKENWVHSLEHGRVLLQYRPGSPTTDIRTLRRVAEEPINDSAGYHVLLFENDTRMPARYAAVAWTRSMTCPRLTPQSIDAMRAFRRAYTDKGPEFIP